MKSFASVISICVIGLLISLSDRVQSCNLAAVNACTNLLQTHLGLSLSEGIIAIPTTEQLDRMCSNITTFKECYEPEAALCKNDVIFSMTFGTIAETVQYLCTDGYGDIVQYNTCWNKSGVAEATNMCHLQQHQMISDLQDIASGLDPADLRSVWCQIIGNTTSCMTEAVSERCSGGATCVMDTMMRRSLGGVATFMQCPNESSNCSISPTPSVSSTSSSSLGSTTSSTLTTSSKITTTTKDNRPSDKQDLSGYSTGNKLGVDLVIATLLLLLTMFRCS